MSDTFQTTPLEVASADDIQWTDTADVVIVGFGGAGAAAAVEAGKNGTSVIAIDRFGGGGATAYSGGVIYAGGTPYLRESGFNDTADEMYKYLEAEGLAVHPASLRRYCEGSAGDVQWLDDLGIPHGSNAFTDKTSFPPDGHWLYYSGSEKMPEFETVAKHAPRGHRVATKGFGGHLHYARLKEAALAQGTRLLTHSPVTRLIQDHSGRVLGVEINALPADMHATHDRLYKVVNPWRPFNNKRALKAATQVRALEAKHLGRQYIRAHRGVVLSTGGFGYSEDLMRRYQPILARNFDSILILGSMGDDGSGILLGESVGGAAKRMDEVSLARTMFPPTAFANGIAVNSRGERFVNETAYAFTVGKVLLQQPDDGHAYLIINNDDFKKGVFKSFFPGRGIFLLWGAPALLNIFGGGTKRASSLQKLAKKIGVDAAGLERTVAEYNTTARAAAPDRFGKLKEHMKPIADKGPYWALNISLSNRFAPAQVMTNGGLDVDEDTGMVRRADNSLIPGLYAAGRSSIGICSPGYVASGLSIADTVFGGRRAGRAVAGSN